MKMKGVHKVGVGFSYKTNISEFIIKPIPTDLRKKHITKGRGLLYSFQNYKCYRIETYTTNA